MQCLLMKMPQGMLVPADEESMDAVKRIKVGEVVKATVTNPRNIGFMRKYFAMLNVGYDAFVPAPVTIKGKAVVPEKSREEFRAWVTVQAGFYHVYGYPDGSVRLRPKSISFAEMGEEEFAQVYSKVVDVLLQRVLTNYTRDDLDRVVDKIMGFV